MGYKKVATLSSIFLSLLVLPSVVAAQPGFNWLSDSRPLYQVMGVEFGVTAFVGITILALFPDWGQQAVRTARRGAGFSFVIGIPGILSVWTVWLLSLLLTATIIGGIVGLPLAVMAFVFEAVWSTVGYIAVGTVLGARLGWDNVWLGVFVGGLLGAVLAPFPYLGRGIGILISILGIGASLRVSFGAGGVNDRERTVPPAHRT